MTEDYAKSGIGDFRTWVPRFGKLREQLARLIGAEKKHIGFVSNTTHGVIDIAPGLPWKKGDRVVLFDCEFPANVTPWQRARQTFDLEIRCVSLDYFEHSQEEGLAKLQKVLGRGARLVAERRRNKGPGDTGLFTAEISIDLN